MTTQEGVTSLYDEDGEVVGGNGEENQQYQQEQESQVIQQQEQGTMSSSALRENSTRRLEIRINQSRVNCVSILLLILITNEELSPDRQLVRSETRLRTRMWSDDQCLTRRRNDNDYEEAMQLRDCATSIKIM